MFSQYLGNVPACILLSTLLMPCVSAQEMSTVPARLTIPDGTPIQLQLTESVSSAHARVGDLLDFVVVRNVSVEGFTVIPAGTVASGSVTAVKGKRILGIGGNVALKLDSVELVNGEQVSLRGRMDLKGHSRTKLMVAGMISTALAFLPATPVFLLTRGHDGTVLKSTEITAQIDGDISVLSAGLQRSIEEPPKLDGMMDYLPSRVFNGEGREGDMLNLVFIGQQEDLQKAFERAGWVKTDKYKPIFVWHLLRYRTNDARLPMSRLFCSEECRTTRMPYQSRVRPACGVTIFESGKPIPRWMGRPSGRVRPPTTLRLKSRSGGICSPTESTPQSMWNVISLEPT